EQRIERHGRGVNVSLRRAEVINRRPHPFEEQPDAPQVKTRSVFRLCKAEDSCCLKNRCGFRFWVTEARGAFTGGRSKVAAERPIKLGELPETTPVLMATTVSDLAQ